MNERTSERTNERASEPRQTNEGANELANGRTNGRTNERASERTNEYSTVGLLFILFLPFQVRKLFYFVSERILMVIKCVLVLVVTMEYAVFSSTAAFNIHWFR